MGNKKDKGNDNSKDKPNNVIRFPKEITKSCGACGMDISALPADMSAAMSLHMTLAHGDD